MLYYFLKTIFLLGIFYMLYTVFLKQHTSFVWNRMYLLLTSLAAILIPLISFSALENAPAVQSLNTNTLYTDAVNNMTVYSNAIRHTEIDSIKIIFVLLSMGMLWGLTRIAFGLYIVYRLKQYSSNEMVEKTNVYFNTQIDTPFSFFNLIFLPEAFRNKDVLHIILKHEEAHIALKHSYDKFYFSLLQSFFWFNPFVYLYHKELELQHEFEADSYSVKQIETDHYVKNLLETITYNQTPTLLVHQFFHHPLKTRITMLYKKSKNLIMQKTLVVCSTTLLLSVTLFLQSNAQHSKKHDPTPTNVKIMNPNNPGESMDLTLTKSPDSLKDKSTVDVMPQFIGGEDAMNAYISEHKGKLSDDIRPSKPLQVQLVISSTGRVASVGADPFIDEKIQKDIAKVFKNMPTWKPGIKDGKPVPVVTYAHITY